MSVDFSLASLNPIGPIDLTAGLKGAPEKTRIEKVSKAMEALFVNQLTSELGKSIDGKDDATEGQYGDFIQQAMTQGVTQGGGLGLAKIIENSLNHSTTTQAAHMPLKTPNTSYHVNHAE
jgi:Rod binding domain-containing protein